MSAERPSPPTPFSDVLRDERGEIRVRRAYFDPAEDTATPPRDLCGLALSGGGIRSATFSLGVLQELNRLKVLPVFDYLSTVSGGGYIGGWWSAWLSRNWNGGGLFPGEDRIEPVPAASLTRDPGHGTRSRQETSRRTELRPPVHHLRLFANYLTPRRGMFSIDTWRAVTVITSNLLLTWAVLVPLLLATVVAGQLVYTAQGTQCGSLLYHPDIFCSADREPQTDARTASVASGPKRRPVVGGAAHAGGGAMPEARRQDSPDNSELRLASMRARAKWVLPPLLALAGIILSLSLARLLTAPPRRSGRWASALGLGGAALTALLAVGALSEASRLRAPGHFVLLSLGVAGLVAALGAARFPLARAFVTDGKSLDWSLARNRLVRVQSYLLAALVVLAWVLSVAGFSHDLLWYLFRAQSDSWIVEYTARAGGWGGILATLAASVFTAWKASPSTADGVAQARPSKISHLVFAVAPPLVLAVGSILLAAAAHALLMRWLDRDPVETFTQLRVAVLAGCGMCVFYTLYELTTGETERSPRTLLWILAALMLALLAAITMSLLVRKGSIPARTGVPLTGWAVMSVLGVRWARSFSRSRWTSVLPVVVATGLCYWLLGVLSAAEAADQNLLLPVSMPVIAFCGAFALAEMAAGRERQRRALGLVTAAFLILWSLLVLGLKDPSFQSRPGHASAVLIVLAIALAWVVGLGWMADPNQLSLHAFYKARLTRAYLGASNPDRLHAQASEALAGDDVPLSGLKNCERGAPYHLINATINLVGGRDLAAGQRSADSFLLSRQYCGSESTEYRPTTAYMQGALELGTAIAISGAAASPNMGSKTPTAALSMLLTFFNVRLGYWAPTPDQPRWRSSQTRLWPFYMLREFLSQTDALASYCYLTDGGHFDNTGMYALVARGCRYLVVVDCGADPKPCFADLGNAIRRCRIDFGAEIDLKIDQLLCDSATPATAHLAVGTITYSEAHAASLDMSPDQRHGIVVWIRPSLTAGDEAADVRQYHLENRGFPQQTTADQWFDEAQFESYRKLGEQSARAAFGAREVLEPLLPRDARRFFERLKHTRRQTFPVPPIRPRQAAAARAL